MILLSPCSTDSMKMWRGCCITQTMCECAQKDMWWVMNANSRMRDLMCSYYLAFANVSKDSLILGENYSKCTSALVVQPSHCWLNNCILQHSVKMLFLFLFEASVTHRLQDKFGVTSINFIFNPLTAGVAYIRVLIFY